MFDFEYHYYDIQNWNNDIKELILTGMVNSNYEFIGLALENSS